LVPFYSAIGRPSIDPKWMIRMLTVGDLADELAVVALVRQTMNEEKFSVSPRLAPLKAALAKLDPKP
jgi:hypothetical protein